MTSMGCLYGVLSSQWLFLSTAGFVDTLVAIKAGSRDMCTMSRDGLRRYGQAHFLLSEARTCIHDQKHTDKNNTLHHYRVDIWTFQWFRHHRCLDRDWNNRRSHTCEYISLYFRKLREFKMQYFLIPLIATIVYLFALYGSFISIGNIVLIAVAVIVIYLLIGAFYYGGKNNLTIKLEEGEEV